MISLGIIFEGEKEDEKGILFLADRGILTKRRLVYEGVNLKMLNKNPSIVIAFPGVSTAIQADFALRTGEFFLSNKIQDCADFGDKLHKLHHCYKDMTKFYTEGEEGLLTDFLLGISDKEGDVELCYVKIGEDFAFEILSDYSNYGLTLFGERETGLFIKEVITKFERENLPINFEVAFELAIMSIKLVEKLYRMVSPKFDICVLQKGDVSFIPYENIEKDGVVSFIDAKKDAIFKLLFDLIEFPEPENVKKVYDLIFKQKEDR